MLGKIGTAIGMSTARGGLLPTVKAVALSPWFGGVVLLGGVIGWQIWQGKKDAQEMETAEETLEK